ncbi:DNA alkylation repair protein [Amylibacter marinus]|uniref:DNA alkylation repair protein n=1 Tax=Amylibacter marinus TaxID=1475483 RepID=A0ABQ5VTY6_9RHOB|nr:DNA alkylation repair protein [Amylibacter marinus]GLQ34794.1 DNA alkylation repair protein [Amylibacter marinus]
MITLNTALEQLSALANPARAQKQAKQNKIERPYLGVTNPEIDVLYKQWRADVDGADRLTLAAGLWDSNIFEARIAAAKLLTQARISPDAAVWDTLISWIDDLDGWAIGEQVMGALARRFMAVPDRFEILENWAEVDSPWHRAATLMITQPLTKLNNPKQAEQAQRDAILGMAGQLVGDHNTFVQRALADWLRTLGKHAPNQTQAFLDEFSAQMNPLTLAEANKHL